MIYIVYEETKDNRQNILGEFNSFQEAVDFIEKLRKIDNQTSYHIYKDE